MSFCRGNCPRRQARRRLSARSSNSTTPGNLRKASRAPSTSIPIARWKWVGICFGEEYARGMFLVRMREEMRKYNLAESVELPDHISHVLAVVAAMPDDEAPVLSARVCCRRSTR